MSFGQELKDFVSSFQAGWKLATPTRGDVAMRAYKDAKDEKDQLTKAQEREQAKAQMRSALPVQSRATTDTPGSDGSDDDARVLAAEAGSEGDEGMTAAAHVINNRANLTGMSPGDVVRAKGQFEAYGNGSYRKYGPGNPAYDQAKTILDEVRSGKRPDPTGGATHYYNPELNRQLAEQRGDRRAVPAWDNGKGMRIGRHVFFARPEDFQRAASKPTQVAQSPATAYNSMDEGDQEEGLSFARGGVVPEGDWRRYNTGDYVSDEEALETLPDNEERENLPSSGDREYVASLNRPELTRLGREMPRQDLSPTQAPEPIGGTEVVDTRNSPLEEPNPGERRALPLEPLDPRNSPLEEPNPGKRRRVPTPPRRPRALDTGERVASAGAPTSAQEAPSQPEQPRQALPVRDTFNSDKAGTGSEYDPREYANPAGAAQAVDAGMKRIAQVFGFQGAIQQADPLAQERAVAFAKNVGAPSIQEVRAVQQVVDPRRQLTENERTMAALYAGYDFYLKRGEPQKAANFAMSMMMHAKRAIQMSGAIAQAAAEKGDAVGAAKAIAGGYAMVPNGQEVKVTGAGPQGVEFGVYDAQGNLTDKGKATLNDLMRVATGMQDGTEWFRQMGLLGQNGQQKALTPYQQRQQALQERRLNLEERRLNAKEGAANGGATTKPTRQPAAPRLTEKERKAQADQQELADARLRDQGAQLDEPQSFRENRVGNREQAAGALADVRYKQATPKEGVESDADADEAVKGVVGDKELSPNVKFAWRSAVSQVASANKIANDQAAYVVNQAVQPGSNVQLRDGKLYVPGIPNPIVIGREGLTQLAIIRGSLRPQATPGPAQAQVAQPRQAIPLQGANDADRAEARRVLDQSAKRAGGETPGFVTNPYLRDQLSRR